ncbi:hypothetical protein PY365_04570 [Roseiarcaceae bacterium H3SJ34-1]|uniref:hypothetical protein n=1 Tax=Terripilifer ovatus TaxID=3032367 RepID=UPI003AB92C49|nr:hypothetical protein [Roseiarcaceae bacterium H3SJ34-1]
MKVHAWLAREEVRFDHEFETTMKPSPLGVAAVVIGTLGFWAAIAMLIRTVV